MTELRLYQSDVIEQCQQKLLTGVSKVCLVAPTGSGKTVIAAEIIRKTVEDGKRVLVLAHICDDLHDVSGIESEADREAVLRFFQEISSTRLNNPKEAAVIVVQQRLHEEDTVGWIYANAKEGEWEHLMVPMKFDSQRCCQTSIGWTDPRGCDDETGDPLLSFPDRQPISPEAQEILEKREGALLWPERFGAAEVDALEASLGPAAEAL